MADNTLQGRHILVVEDEYYLADQISMELEDEGAMVLGPAPTVKKALDLIKRTPFIDVAVLDLNLGGESALSVADVLMAQRVPVVLTTGYDASHIPAHYKDLRHCEKPIDLASLKRMIAEAIRGRP